MYTVIIAEKKHFDAIEQNKLYFKPFLDRLNEDVVFCEWNVGGNNFYDCVPNLVGLVGRHKSWRAVILKDDDKAACINPFDSIDKSRVAQCEEEFRLVHPFEMDDVVTASSNDGGDSGDEGRFDRWKKDCSDRMKSLLEAKEKIFRDALELPFQKLVTCLCFIPDESAHRSEAKKSSEQDYFDSVIDSENFEKYLVELEHLFHLEQDSLKYKLRRESIEKLLPGDRISRTAGSMGIALPSEVYCFAERTTESGFFDAGVYWENHTGLEYSDFVGRNMYFDKMRFITSDILPSTHQNYRYDRIRFLYNLMLFALNEVPSGAVLPRKLYRLETENNESSLGSIAGAYLNKLNSTIEVVDAQIEKIRNEIPRELSDSDSEKLFCKRSGIPVTTAEDFYEEELYANGSDYGYFSDSFGDDATNWTRQTKLTDDNVEKLAKQPRRALKKSIEKLEYECDVDYNMIRAMNSFQMDDVRDYTEAEKDKMVSLEINNIFDLSEYHDSIDKESKKVSAVIKRRMKKKTNLILGFVCILLFVLSNLPLFFSNRANIDTVSTAFLFCLTFTSVLFLVLVLTVIFLRMPLRKALRSFNANVKDIEDEVKDSMQKYSEYLSCVANVRRGYKVLTFSENNIDKFDRDIRTRRKHKNDMEVMRAFILDNYGDFLSDNIVCDELSYIPYNYDFGVENEEYDYYPPYIPDDRVYIDFLAAGNKIELSSDFVTDINLRMEEIYD